MIHNNGWTNQEQDKNNIISLAASLNEPQIFPPILFAFSRLPSILYSKYPGMTQHQWIKMANLLFELDKKLSTAQQPPSIVRNVDRMKAVLEEAGLLLLNPMGEPYNEARTDLEASITGAAAGKLYVLDVIKPILYTEQNGGRILVQKGVVIVGNK